MAIFVLMRHGEADIEAARQRGMIGGCIDWAPLTDKGAGEVCGAAKELRGRGLELIVCSPMTRAVHSAAILSWELDLPLVVEFDLHEWLPDLTFRYSCLADVQRAIEERDAYDCEWPIGERRNWEPFSTVRQRVQGVLGRYAHHARVLVVCHHVVIRALMGERLGHGERVEFQFGEVSCE